MSKRRTLLTVVSAVVVAAGALGLSGDQWHRPADRTVIIPAGEVHDGWFFGAGNEVIIEGTIKGDAFVAGGMVRVEGTVEGDLVAAGGSIVINGKVTDDVWATGGNIDCDGTVGKNVAALGGSLTLGKSSAVGGGVLAAGGQVSLSGSVARKVLVGAEELNVLGSVGEDLGFGGERITVRKDAKVHGDLRIRVGDSSKVDIAEGTVAGTVTIVEEPVEDLAESGGIVGLSVIWRALWILAFVVTALALVLLFPDVVNGVGATIVSKPGMSMLWGLIALIVTPVVVILLLVTVLGIPLALLLLTLYLWLLYLTQLTFGIVIGRQVFKTEGKKGWSLFWPLAVALIALELVVLIPYLGFLVRLAAVLFGLGSLLIVLKEYWKKASVSLE